MARDELKARQGPRKLNLRTTTRKTRNMRDPYLIIKWDSYKGELTALARKFMIEVSVVNGKGSTEPSHLDVSELEPDSLDIAAQPTSERGPSTVEVNWVGKKNEPRIDLHDYLLLKKDKFTIPHRHKAYVPVQRKVVPGLEGESLLFLFSQVEYEEITSTRTKKSSTSSSSGTTTPNPAPAQPPSTPQ